MLAFDIWQPSLLLISQNEAQRFLSAVGDELRRSGAWNVKTHADRVEFGEFPIPRCRQPASLSGGSIFVGPDGGVGFEGKVSWLTLAAPLFVFGVVALLMALRMPLEKWWFIALILVLPWVHLLSIQTRANDWLTGLVRQSATAMSDSQAPVGQPN